MPAIIIGQTKKIASLFPPEALIKLGYVITSAIQKSLEEQKMRNLTHAEVKERFEIVMKHAVILRGELSWGLERICDVVPDILKTELSGRRWDPPSNPRQCWIPSDGA